jgi:hypothetical protein
MYKESVNFPIEFQEKSDCLADVVALSANQRAHQNSANPSGLATMVIVVIVDIRRPCICVGTSR